MLPRIIRNSEIRPFGDFFDTFFDDTPGRFGWGRREAHGMLKMDVKEEDGNYIVDVDLPGCKKEDITLTLDEGMLTVSAVRNQAVDEKDEAGNYIRRERFSGRCSRSIPIGDIAAEDIKAKFEDGVLTLTYPAPKAEEPKPNLIPIE